MTKEEFQAFVAKQIQEEFGSQPPWWADEIWESASEVIAEEYEEQMQAAWQRGVDQANECGGGCVNS